MCQECGERVSKRVCNVFGPHVERCRMSVELKVKPFKLRRCQELSEDHKQQRLVFCN